MQVHNLSGTAASRYNEPPYGYGSWREYWEETMGRKFSYCSRNICLNEATVGGHVQKQDGNDRRWYIVPLCKSCNNIHSDIYFDVNGYDLCPVCK